MIFQSSPACLVGSLLLVTILSGKIEGKERLFPTGTHGQGELRYSGNLPVAFLAGTPAEIGEQHAALLGKPAAPLLQFGKKLLAAMGTDEVEVAAKWPFVVQASQQLLVQAPQRFREELQVVAQHANLDGDELGVANTLLELRQLGCATLMAMPTRSATGGPLFARNFDFPPFGLLDKYSLLIIVRPTDRHAFAAVGYPGLVGVLSGMNDAGLAVATLDVYESANGSPKFEPTGVPQLLVYRQILEECTTVDEAAALLQRTKATTWANLAVCDRNGGAIFEITPTEVVRRDPSDAVLVCTNHFRSPGLAVDTDCWRFESLLGAKQQAKLDVAALHQHLHAANQGELTLHSMVFEPRELVLHLALGAPPSSAHLLQRVELREFFESKAAR